MKGIKKEDVEILDALMKSASVTSGVGLLELQIKTVVRLRKLVSTASGTSAKEHLSSEIVQRYIAAMLEWLLFKNGDDEDVDRGSLVSTGRAKVFEDVLWLLTR
jgi:hypothetical protein